MTIEVLNESGHELDVRELARLSRFVMDVMRVHPQAELCIEAVDEDTIAELNEKWMEKEGPTDVLAFPMDELRPGKVNEEPEEGVLGDLVVAPAVAERQGQEAGQQDQQGRRSELPDVGGHDQPGSWSAWSWLARHLSSSSACRPNITACSSGSAWS